MLGLPRTHGVRSISKAGISRRHGHASTTTWISTSRARRCSSACRTRWRSCRRGCSRCSGPPATAMGEVFEYLVESTSDSDTSLDRSDERPGVHDQAAAADRSRRRRRERVGRHAAAVPGARRSSEARRLRPHARRPRGARSRTTTRTSARGYIEDRGERLTRPRARPRRDTADIASVVVATTRRRRRSGARCRRRSRSAPQPRYGAVTRDGKGEALSATVIMLKGSNGRDVVERVDGAARGDRAAAAEGRAASARSTTRAKSSSDTTHTVFRNLIEGALLVIAILFLFLRNVRASLITASVIPLSLLFAFLAMKRFRRLGQPHEPRRARLRADRRRVGGDGRELRAPAASRATPPCRPARSLRPRGRFEVGRPDRVRRRDHRRRLHPDLHAQGLEGRMFRADGVHRLRGGARLAAARADLRAGVLARRSPAVERRRSETPRAALVRARCGAATRGCSSWALAHRAAVHRWRARAAAARARLGARSSARSSCPSSTKATC